MPRTPTRRRLYIVCISLLLSFVFYLFPNEVTLSKQHSQNTAPIQESVYIKRVIDGDTFLLSNGEKVRLTGIDTPESRINEKTQRDSVRSGKDLKTITSQGKEATKFVRKLVEGKKIRIEYDVQKRDRYGRLLIYAYDINTLKENPQIRLSDGIVVSANREIFLNGSIIGSGYAVPMTVPPNVRHAEFFKKLYSEARAERRGLWAN